MPPTTGMQFSRFELVARLGAGGMGEVWRARDRDLLRDVAVKFLPERFAADPTRLGRFEQEARAASSLNHPNIVTIHEIGETSGLPYIVMEMVNGHTLRDLLLAQKGRPLVTARLVDIGAQAADGLAKAHAAGIVHRDLKPENLMVTADGFVKILDFGLAKLHAVDSGDEPLFDSKAPTWPDPPSPHTAVGAVVGTATYMSPEQARGGRVDFRSDQFALGSILYELATCRQAFRRESPVQTLAAIIEDPPEPLATLNPSLPAPLGSVIERCLAKEPSDRYAATPDLAAELRRLRDQLPRTGGSDPSAPSQPAGGSPPRGLVRAAVLGGSVLALAAAAWFGRPLAERVAVVLGARPVPAVKRVAVLPFLPLAGTEGDRALVEGIVDLLTARLASLESFQAGLGVEPAANVLRAGVTSAEQARRALDATLVITGTVQRVEGRLVLTAALEDPRNKRRLRETTAGSLDALADGVVQMLELELGTDARAAFRALGTGVAEAASLTAQALGYSPYVEGRSALERYEQSRSLERAIELFTLALERDPRYALAHAGLGETYWRLYRLTRKLEYVPLAQQHCERALALDDLSAPPWVTLGMIHGGTGKPEEALADFQKALDRNPRNPDTHRERGRVLEQVGRWEEAEAAYRKATELRPESWASRNYLGAFLYGRGRLPEAEAEFRRALAFAPDNARVLQNLGGVLFSLGRREEAERTLRRSLDLSPTVEAASNLATTLFYDGRRVEGAEALARAVRPDELDYKVWQNLAAMYYWAPGMRGRAADAYRRAADLAERERTIDPRRPSLLADLADCRVMLGDKAGALRLAGEAVALAPRDAEVALAVAGVHEQVGDRRAALEWIGVALRLGADRETIDADPSLESLRADPRYAALARRKDSRTE